MQKKIIFEKTILCGLMLYVSLAQFRRQANLDLIPRAFYTPVFALCFQRF